MRLTWSARSAVAVLVVACLTGCSFHGITSLPLPGTVGNGPGAHTYSVELKNVGNLEPNAPVLMNDVVVGNIRGIAIENRHAVVRISVRPDVVVPANAVAAVGQTSLLGSMHLEINPPLGEAPSGMLAAGSTIGLDRSSTYPSTEQTLGALASVVNAGGLGKIGDIISEFNAVFTGRQTELRDLLGQLDTLVGALDTQRDNIIATITELDRFTATMSSHRELIDQALHDIPPMLDVLITQRPRFTAALEALRRFSDTARTVVTDVQGDLVENLRHLEPVFRALVDVGPDISTALAFLPVFPLGQGLIDQGIRGDYMNLFVTVDLTLSRFRRGLLLGTSFGDENAPLVPAPGDPGYDSFPFKNARGEAVALPPGVMGPDRLPPRDGGG
ncbi:MCE family protein [Mycobacterium sp. ACS4331]|uniref:MCE family protein n=1 Tax=Mycobacterium sp. ACS4331 TaxID=1834121 RepID=UPI0007FC59D9|nr:MCE family protein [Mycobacterium sp. ACS4331]OBF11975.1 mammalian cell entry protein [Mycobacterium sp. ACS4331]